MQATHEWAGPNRLKRISISDPKTGSRGPDEIIQPGEAFCPREGELLAYPKFCRPLNGRSAHSAEPREPRRRRGRPPGSRNRRQIEEVSPEQQEPTPEEA